MGTIALACFGMAATLVVAGNIETEFMPPLNGGSILYMPSAPQYIRHGCCANLTKYGCGH